MTETTIAVIARLTPDTQHFPVGAWFYHTEDRQWYMRWSQKQIRDINGNPVGGDAMRCVWRIPELEANARGIYRPGTEPKEDKNER